MKIEVEISIYDWIEKLYGRPNGLEYVCKICYDRNILFVCHSKNEIFHHLKGHSIGDLC